MRAASMRACAAIGLSRSGSGRIGNRSRPRSGAGQGSRRPDDSGGAAHRQAYRRRPWLRRSAIEILERRQRPGADEGSPTAEWIVHLGMTGRLLVTTPEAPVAPHTHARLTLASGRELRFVDPRRLGGWIPRSAPGRWLRRAGRRAADHRAGGIRRAVSRPEAGDQGRSAQSDAAGGRGKHLCG